MDLWNALAGIPGIGPALPYLAAAVTLCAALSTALPPGTKGTPYATFRSVIGWVGLNLGHAKKNNVETPAP